jgi:hypothetical protein
LIVRTAIIALMLAVTPAALAADATLADAQYPEGALWHEGRLYYEEMWPNLVRVSDLSTTRTLWSMNGCGPVNIAPYRGEFVVLCHLGNSLVRVSHEGKTIAVIDRDSDGRPFVSPNGAASDGEGGVYFTSSGTFALNAPAQGAVLYLSADGKLYAVPFYAESSFTFGHLSPAGRGGVRRPPPSPMGEKGCGVPLCLRGRGVFVFTVPHRARGSWAVARPSKSFRVIDETGRERASSAVTQQKRSESAGALPARMVA